MFCVLCLSVPSFNIRELNEYMSITLQSSLLFRAFNISVGIECIFHVVHNLVLHLQFVFLIVWYYHVQTIK